MSLILRSLAFHSGFFIGTALIGLCGLPALLGPTSWARGVGTLWSGFVLTWARWTVGITYRLEGALAPGPIIIAAKHQSAFETYLFPVIRPDAVFVLKQELLRVPLVGWYLARSGQIALDRRGGANAMRKLLRQARDRLDAGQTLVIFPEGTRVAPGRSVALQPGVSALYRSTRAPVVPVSVDSGAYWPRNSFLRRPGCVRVIVHPALPAGLTRMEFEGRLTSIFAGHSGGSEGAACVSG